MILIIHSKWDDNDVEENGYLDLSAPTTMRGIPRKQKANIHFNLQESKKQPLVWFNGHSASFSFSCSFLAAAFIFVWFHFVFSVLSSCFLFVISVLWSLSIVSYNYDFVAAPNFVFHFFSYFCILISFECMIIAWPLPSFNFGVKIDFGFPLKKYAILNWEFDRQNLSHKICYMIL